MNIYAIENVYRRMNIVDDEYKMHAAMENMCLGNVHLPSAKNKLTSSGVYFSSIQIHNKNKLNSITANHIYPEK